MSKRRPRNADFNQSEGGVGLHQLDLTSMEPSRLRERILNALALLSADERAFARDNLLAGITAAGVDVGSSFLMMGIPARTAEEVTAPELAMLVRYIQINEPAAISNISDLLLELLSFSQKRESSGELSRKAA